MKKYFEYKKNLEEKGTIMLDIENNIFNEKELLILENLADSLPLEHIEVGDANEPNFLEVGRFMVDKITPELVNRPKSDDALKILNSKKAQEFYQYMLGKKELFIRRMQYNILKKDCFVGLHLDTDSNPDYLVAIVLQFGGNFSGGDYVVYGGNLPPRSFHPPKYSLIISDCKYEHEVTKITSGSRKSLVFFLSSYNGKNLRKN